MKLVASALSRLASAPHRFARGQRMPPSTLMPDKRRQRFRQQERVEHAVDQEHRVEDAGHRDDEAAHAADPQVVAVGPAGHQPLAIQPFGEERAAVDEKRGARRHVGGEDRRNHQAERTGKQQLRHAKPNAFSGSPSAPLTCPCATIAATISPTSAQPTVQTRLTMLP